MQLFVLLPSRGYVIYPWIYMPQIDLIGVYFNSVSIDDLKAVISLFSTDIFSSKKAYLSWSIVKEGNSLLETFCWISVYRIRLLKILFFYEMKTL